jgi:hypothetical protein
MPWLTFEQLVEATPKTIINEPINDGSESETALSARERARRRWFTEREGANARR